MTKNILIIFTFSILIGCAQESRTPANFKLTLGAIESSGSEFPGGIILMGSNGSDQFRVGLTPSQISSYGIELPSGDWNFKAIGWLGEAGTNSGSMMTGEARCAHTSATIEDQDTVIKMALSSDKCFDGKVASTNSQDTEPPAAGTYFKTLRLESCLLTAGQTAGSLCDGSALNNKPGESTSARIVFPSFSNFGASVGPLVSGCWNNSGYASNQITNGSIPTQVRLPFGGERPIPFHIVGFERKNCEDQAAIYRMPDGVDGTLGVSRLFNNGMSQVLLNFADNYIGHGDSAFASDASDLLPSLACQSKANGCYPSTSGLPRDPRAGLKDNFKESIWRYIGNPQNYELHDIQPISQATAATGDGLQIESPFEYGGLRNGTTFIFNNVGGANPVNVTCGQDTFNIDYSATVHTFQDIADNLTGSCPDDFSVFVADPAQSFTYEGSITLSGGDQEIVLERPERGLLSRTKRLLLGPIGAGLHKAGVTSRELICNGTMDGSYDFDIDKEQVSVRLGNPSAAAMLPEFESNYMNTNFERKITVSMSGVPQEAFYFNCVDDTGVGSYLSDETVDNDHPRKIQVFWDTRTVGNEALEVASKEFNSSGQVIRREWFLFKGADSVGNLYHTWLMQASDIDSYYSRAVGRADLPNDFFFVQGQDVTSTSTEELFSKLANDQKYTITQDQDQGSITASTIEPSNQFLNMDIAPTSLSGYSMSDLMNGPILWDVRD